MNDKNLDRLEGHVEGHRYGNYIAARCVFHDDSHASLMIHEDTYRCLACGAFGKTSTLLTKMKAVTAIYRAPIQDDTN